MALRSRHLVAAGGLAAVALLWASRDAWPWRRPLTAAPIVVSTAYHDSALTLGPRETLGQLLQRAGITGRDWAAFLGAATALQPRRLRPGLLFHVRRLVTDSLPDRLMVRTGPAQRLWVERSAAGWTQRVETIPWTIQRVRVVGLIESSLYDALDQAVPDSFLPAVERRQLAWAIADVYDWEVDFTRDVQRGDRFEILLERLESPEGDRRFGRILAARVDVARTPSFAFWFQPDSGQGGVGGGFYDDRGRSLKRAFLRAPLQFRRVTSRFGSRFHPILHEWRTHEGTDYAAAYGTPVRATADGIVTRVGREGGYGNLVEVRHVNGIRTRYGHLSAFAKGLHVGQHVAQSETIAYVGSTGLSTGPHLHYEFLVNGRPTNPQRTSAGEGASVPKSLKDAYDAARALLLAQLEPHPAHVAARVD